MGFTDICIMYHISYIYHAFWSLTDAWNIKIIYTNEIHVMFQYIYILYNQVKGICLFKLSILYGKISNNPFFYAVIQILSRVTQTSFSYLSVFWEVFLFETTTFSREKLCHGYFETLFWKVCGDGWVSKTFVLQSWASKVDIKSPH